MQLLSNTQILALANKVVEGGDADLLCANLQGKMRFATASACSTLGYSLEDLLTKGIADYTPSYTEGNWQNHCQRAISNGSDRIYTYHQGCSGSAYPVVINSIPYLTDDTEEQLICSMVRHARDSDRYQRMLLAGETTHRSGSFDLSFNDQSILASENLLAIMGTTDPESMRPSMIVDRLTKKDAARWSSEMTNFLCGYHRMEEDFVMTIANDRQALVRVSIWSILHEGKVNGIIGQYQVKNSSAKEQMVSLAENQRQHIIRALRYTNGRVTGLNGACRLLEINGKTLFARMKKLDIKREDYQVK